MAQRVPVTLELLSPRAITVRTRQADAPPILLRVVRADTRLPQPGVGVYLSVEIHECVPLLPCEVPPTSLYGYWEGAGNENDYAARNTYVVSDAQGLIAAPRLVGGIAEYWYVIDATVAEIPPFVRSPYNHQVQVIVEQLRSRPRPVPLSPPTAVALAAFLCVSALAARRAG